MTRNIISAFFGFSLMLLFSFLFISTAYANEPFYSMPSTINKSANYLLFQHNYYVETKGPNGDCKYYDILKTFSEKGYIVVSEIRPKDASVVEYGKKAAADVRILTTAGVPPQNITVAGHSKGGVIVLQVAAELENPKVNYLILAGCGMKGLEKGYPDFAKLKGTFLSLYATSDKVAGSCNSSFSQVKSSDSSFKEIALQTDAGHQLFFKPIDLWLEPAIAWLKPGK